MSTFKQGAEQYEAPKTHNIADLDRVSISLTLNDGAGTRTNGEEFKYKFIIVDDKEYRVPSSVIGQLKEILKAMPECKFIGVTKTGEGMNTKYQVIPIQDTAEATTNTETV